MTEPARRSRLILLIVGGAISAALLYFSFRTVDFGDVAEHVGAVSIGILVLSLPVRALTFGLAALRSQVLFRPLHRFGWWRLCKSVLLAFAVNNVIPFRAGEVARIGYLAKHGDLPASTCLAVVALERLLDLFVLAVMFIGVLPAMAADVPIGATFYVLLGGVALAFGGAWIVAHYPGAFVRFCAWCAGFLGSSFGGFVERRAQSFAKGLSGLGSLRAVAAVVGITVVFWLLAGLSLQIYLWAFDFDLPWFTPAVIIGFLTLGLAVPSTPGHIGTYHFFTISALTTVGLAKAKAGSFAIIAHAMAVIPFTVVAALVLMRDFVSQRNRDGA